MARRPLNNGFLEDVLCAMERIDYSGEGRLYQEIAAESRLGVARRTATGVLKALNSLQTRGYVTARPPSPDHPFTGKTALWAIVPHWRRAKAVIAESAAEKRPTPTRVRTIVYLRHEQVAALRELSRRRGARPLAELAREGIEEVLAKYGMATEPPPSRGVTSEVLDAFMARVDKRQAAPLFNKLFVSLGGDDRDMDHRTDGWHDFNVEDAFYAGWGACLLSRKRNTNGGSDG